MKNIVEYETRNGRTYKKTETVDGVAVKSAPKDRPKGRTDAEKQHIKDPEKGEANA